jgi:hypothetical protein
MKEGVKTKGIVITLTLAFLLFTSPYFFAEQDKPTGNLTGFLYEKDGTTPVEGAVVKLTNVSTGTTYDSTSSDSLGVFKISSLAKGIYTFGVETEDGYFNSQNLIGIQAKKEAKMSIALIPDSETGAAPGSPAPAETEEEKPKKREAQVGKVIAYDSDTKTAQIEITNGYMKKEDIHVQSEGLPPQTDFEQKAKELEVEGQSVKRATVGQIVTVEMEQDVLAGDLVYVRCSDCRENIFFKTNEEERLKRREAKVGKIIGFDPTTKSALIEVTHGYLRDEEVVHIMSEGPTPETDFLMLADELMMDGQTVKKVFMGQTVALVMTQNVLEGDLVYVNCCRYFGAIIPLALVGVGLLGEDEEPVSPFKK